MTSGSLWQRLIRSVICCLMKTPSTEPVSI
jgi:hypothetical protein